MPEWTGHLNVGPINARTHDAAAEGLRMAAERVLAESNTKVPFRTGRLQRSGKVSVDDRGLEAVVSYDTDYAVVVHEQRGVNHPGGREAKYLEDAFNELRPVLIAEVAARIRRAWGT